MAVHHRPYQNTVLDEGPLHAGACAISQSTVRGRCHGDESNLSLLCTCLDHQESTEQGRLDTLMFPSGCQTLSMHNHTWVLVGSRLHAALFGNQPKSNDVRSSTVESHVHCRPSSACVACSCGAASTRLPTVHDMKNSVVLCLQGSSKSRRACCALPSGPHLSAPRARAPRPPPPSAHAPTPIPS